MNALTRRLRRLEQRAFPPEDEELRRETEGNARQLLKERLDRIHESFEAARARGEEVPTPTASIEEIQAIFRARLGAPPMRPRRFNHEQASGATQ